MNWIKKHIKSDGHAPQQQQLGPSAHQDSSKVVGGEHNALFRNVDTRKLLFESCPPCPSQPPNSSNDKPMTVTSVTLLGDVHSLTTNMIRDLGFAGQLGNHILLSYGDTLYTQSDLSSDTFRGMTSNSVALATHDPCHVVDSNLKLDKREYGYGWPEQFVQVRKDWGEDMATHAVGITNVIETDSEEGEGVVFTLLNHRPGGVNHIIGAGIAKVSLDQLPVAGGQCGQTVPVARAERTCQFMWDGETEPWYGDCGAVRTTEHIYAYGHKKDNPWVYLARVKVEDVLNVERYEYWHGKTKGWCTERLKGDCVGEEESVFWQVNQGQVIWSPYFKKFLFIYCDNFWSSSLLLRSAPLPEGPWSDTICISKIEPVEEGGTIYAAAPHPYFDRTGKTLVVTYTNHPNRIQGARVEFA